MQDWQRVNRSDTSVILEGRARIFQMSNGRWQKKKKIKKACERAQNNETGKLGQGIAIWSGFNNVRVPGHEAEETD